MSKTPECIAVFDMPVKTGLFDGYQGPIWRQVLAALNSHHGWKDWNVSPDPSPELVDATRRAAAFQAATILEVELYSDGSLRIAGIK